MAKDDYKARRPGELDLSKDEPLQVLLERLAVKFRQSCLLNQLGDIYTLPFLPLILIEISFLRSLKDLLAIF